MSSQAELETYTVVLTQLLRDIDKSVTKWEGTLNPERAVTVLLLIQEAQRDLKLVVEGLEDRIGEAIPEPIHVDGKTVTRRARVNRTKWHDHDDLLRLVLDSRYVNPETGETESQLDIVKRVYPCKGYNARIGELKKLNIDPGEFCTTEFRSGYALQIM